MCSERSPRLIGRQVSPASSVRNAPAAEIAMKIRAGIARIQKDRVQAHSAGARLPARPRAVAAQSGKLLPGLPAVGGAEQGGVFHSGVDRVRIGQRRFQMPDALELPRMRRAVVPLVRAGNAVVDELVVHRLPRLAAVVRALDHLPEPAAGLRCVQPVRVGGRSLDVVDLPAGKMRTADVPLFALAVRRQDERALARADQYSYTASAHRLLSILESRHRLRELILASRASPGSSITGRTSTVPSARPESVPAMPIASSRSLASIRK